MSHSTVKFAFGVITKLRNIVFSDLDVLNAAEKAYRDLVSQRILKDMHNTSTAAIEKLIDDIIKADQEDDLQVLLRGQNPNLLAFLYARFLNAYNFLRDADQEKLLPVESHPKLLAEWALRDLWEQSSDSDDPY